MTEEHRLISAESVTEGHPDKVCDQISDAILDDLLAQDSSSHVAVETSAATGVFLVFGEVTSEGYCDVQSKVRETLRNIGYTSSEVGLDADSCGVVVAITEQSAEINQGVARLTGDQETAASREERYEAQGAGDQGVMFGYATDETPTLMPLPIYLAHRLAFRLTEVRKSGEVPHLRPDGKTQVTIEYDDNDKPVRLDTVLISTQHDPEVTQDWLAVELKKHVIDPVLDEVLGSKVPHDNYRQLVNPTGSFILGGPAADAGLTGRKIIVDTYGGAAHHGGGAFSGKDPSKVDRSAAYATRWVAKNIVAAGLAHKVEIQVAYAIGVADPVSINVETFGTEQGVTRGQIAAAVRNSNQGVSGLRFFELGRVFRNTGGGKGRDIETDTLGILVSGDRTARSWADPRPEQASFEDLLAVMAALAPGHRFTLTPARPREQAALGADVQLDGKACGYFARLSLARCRELGLGQPVYVAELDLRKMQEILTAPVKAAELPQFPGSSRDAAMELPLSTPNADIVKAVESAREKLLVSYFCFDVFTDPSGEKLPADRKSIAYTFLYRDPAKTLTAAEVDAAHQRVLKALTDKVKGLSFR